MFILMRLRIKVLLRNVVGASACMVDEYGRMDTSVGWTIEKEKDMWAARMFGIGDS